jgi:DNA polymerase-3 subunit delta'
MGHSWIFVGPEGVGKSTLAFRLARELLAQGYTVPVDIEVESNSASLFGAMEAAPQPVVNLTDPHSPQHPVFKQVAALSHPDLLIVDSTNEEGEPKREITADDVRAVTTFLRSTSLSGGWRIVIVDEAERMNRNAANALLKILEEPPPRSMLILIASTLGRFPATIRSRCRLLPFQPLADEVVADLLEKIYPGTDTERLVKAAALSGGSIGKAKQIVEEEGDVIYAQLIESLQDLPKLNEPSLHAMADKFLGSKSKRKEELICGFMIDIIYDVILAGSGAKTPEIYETRLLSYQPVPFWLALYQELSESFDLALRLNNDLKTVWLNAFTRLQGVKVAA